VRFHLLPVASALFLIYVRRGFQDVECILIFIVLQFVSRTYDRINGRRQKEKTGYQKNIFHSYFKLPDGFVPAALGKKLLESHLVPALVGLFHFAIQ